MCVQRETGAHRAVKVIKKSFETAKSKESDALRSAAGKQYEEFTKEEREAAEELKLHREKGVKELLNEVKVLCSLVRLWL